MREEGNCFQNTNILDLQISQGSVATRLRWGGSLYNRSVENFLQNLTVKELWKLCSYAAVMTKKTKWLFFWNTAYISSFMSKSG